MDVSLNMLDLKYFTNNTAYKKILKTTKFDKKNADELYSKTDYKFYKKRIFKLVKDIMQNKNKHPSLVNSFNIFIKESIEYIKFVDTTESLQENFTNEKKDMERNKKVQFATNILNEGNNLLFNNNLTPNTIKIEECIPIRKISTKKETKLFYQNKKI